MSKHPVVASWSARRASRKSPRREPLDTAMASVALVQEQLMRNSVAHNRAGPPVIVYRGYTIVSVPGMTA